MKGVNYGNKFVLEPWMSHRGESVWGTKYGPAATLSPGAQKYQASFSGASSKTLLLRRDKQWQSVIIVAADLVHGGERGVFFWGGRWVLFFGEDPWNHSP